jgi:hypothetical protein
MTALTRYRDHPAAHLPQDGKTPLEKIKDKLRAMIHERPSTGRSSKLGRKVEKPGEGGPGGPSGQQDHVSHDRKHTNK